MRHPASLKRAQGQVEYALILVITSMVVIVILLTMGNSIKNLLRNIDCSYQSTSCATLTLQPSPTACTSPQAPTVPPEQTSTPVYTFTPADFSTHHQVLQGSLIRVLLPCLASYRSVSTPALTPLLFDSGYAVLIASSPGDASISGPLDHSLHPSLWHIDVTVIAP